MEPDKIKEKGRGKKEVVMELVKCPPTYTNIVTFHMSLDNLLNGEFEQQKIFTTGSAQSLTNSHSKTLADGAFVSIFNLLPMRVVCMKTYYIHFT